jgi:hypothetical protein
LVPTCRAVTVTPGSTPPELSRTTPASVALRLWAASGAAAARRRMRNRALRQNSGQATRRKKIEAGRPVRQFRAVRETTYKEFETHRTNWVIPT